MLQAVCAIIVENLVETLCYAEARINASGQEAYVKNLLDILQNDGNFIARLFVAMVLGGIIGLERQSRGRPAGLRTHILVCLGSAAVIVAFQKLYVDVNPGAQSAIRMDPARAAAGV